MISGVLALPWECGETLQGMLFLAPAGEEAQFVEQIRETGNYLVEAFTPSLCGSRFRLRKRFVPLSLGIAESGAVEQAVSDIIESASLRRSAVFFYTVRLSRLVTPGEIDYPHMERFRFEQDVLRILSGVVGNGLVLRTGPDLVLVALRTRVQYDPLFLFDHVFGSLADFGFDCTAARDSVVSSAEYPSGVGSAEELIRSLQ